MIKVNLIKLSSEEIQDQKANSGGDLKSSCRGWGCHARGVQRGARWGWSGIDRGFNLTKINWCQLIQKS